MSARASVLYDLPGPNAIRRHRIAGGIGALGIAAILGLVLFRLGQEGQLSADTWEFLAVPETYVALWEGLLDTLQVAAVAIALALGLGTLLAVARLSDTRLVRWPAVVVVEFFRAVPLLLLILFIFLGFSAQIGRFWSLALALMLYNGSVLAEIFRAGILSVPRGQSEAGYAIGLRKAQVQRLVLVPQAVRIMLPAIISQSVVALKDSALGSIIAYGELARVRPAALRLLQQPPGGRAGDRRDLRGDQLHALAPRRRPRGAPAPPDRRAGWWGGARCRAGRRRRDLGGLDGVRALDDLGRAGDASEGPLGELVARVGGVDQRPADAPALPRVRGE